MAIHSLWKARLSFFSCFGISLNCVLRLGMMGCAVLEVSIGIQALKSFQLCPRLVYKQHCDHIQILEARRIMNVSKTSCVVPLAFEVRQDRLEGGSKLRNYRVKQVDFQSGLQCIEPCSCSQAVSMLGMIQILKYLILSN